MCVFIYLFIYLFIIIIITILFICIAPFIRDHVAQRNTEKEMSVMLGLYLYSVISYHTMNNVIKAHVQGCDCRIFMLQIICFNTT